MHSCISQQSHCVPSDGVLLRQREHSRRPANYLKPCTLPPVLDSNLVSSNSSSQGSGRNKASKFTTTTEARRTASFALASDQNQVVLCSECHGRCTLRCLRSHVDSFSCHNRSCVVNQGLAHLDEEGILWPEGKHPPPAPPRRDRGYDDDDESEPDRRPGAYAEADDFDRGGRFSHTRATSPLPSHPLSVISSAGMPLGMIRLAAATGFEVVCSEVVHLGMIPLHLVSLGAVSLRAVL
ncbi:hypothetical protein VTK56DRAFT_6079 [Thermocarpiscus australiensis]